MYAHIYSTYLFTYARDYAWMHDWVDVCMYVIVPVSVYVWLFVGLYIHRMPHWHTVKKFMWFICLAFYVHVCKHGPLGRAVVAIDIHPVQTWRFPTLSWSWHSGRALSFIPNRPNRTHLRIKPGCVAHQILEKLTIVKPETWYRHSQLQMLSTILDTFWPGNM